MPQPATAATRAAAASLIAYYYRLDIPLSYYVGGGFYWYFAEDMVPWRSSPLWGALARSWSVRPSAQLRARSTTADVGAPPPHAAFSYQIGGAFPPAAGVAVVDRDWHALPASGTYGICYLNAFQAQPEELAWWRSHHRSLLLRRGGRPVIDTAWNEQLLDTSTSAKRRALAAIIGGWIDRCARVGYRAVEPDNLDSWTRSRGALTAADNLALARLLIARAHGAGLAIAQKNAAELARTGRRIGFDFAIAEECQAYEECGSYVSAYGDRVIEIEYPDDGGEGNFARACRLRGKRISIVYRDRDVTPAGLPGFIERRCPIVRWRTDFTPPPILQPAHCREDAERAIVHPSPAKQEGGPPARRAPFAAESVAFSQSGSQVYERFSRKARPIVRVTRFLPARQDAAPQNRLRGLLLNALLR